MFIASISWWQSELSTKVMSLKWLLKQLLKKLRRSWENNSIMEPRVRAVNLHPFLLLLFSFLPPFFMTLGSRVTFCWQDKNAKFPPLLPQLPHLFYMEKIFYQMEKVGWKNNKITISNRLYFGSKIVTFGLLLWFMIGFLMGNIVVQLCNRYTAFILV